MGAVLHASRTARRPGYAINYDSNLEREYVPVDESTWKISIATLYVWAWFISYPALICTNGHFFLVHNFLHVIIMNVTG